MAMLQRNQLVWLSAAGWATVRAADWDAQATEILTHWEGADLPLVVARQRTEVPDDRVCLGLPAPAQWGRRRLAVDVRANDVGRAGPFPTFAEALGMAQQQPALPIRVYGSFGWQALTGLEYVHPQSDLDVLAEARNLQDAVQIAGTLMAWNAPWRVDGELMLPGGHAVAWRELLQASQGTVAHVLVKHRKFAALMALDGLQTALGLPATLK